MTQTPEPTAPTTEPSAPEGMSPENDAPAESPLIADSPDVDRSWKSLIMPGLLIAFATYLLIGMLTMRVPAGSDFPGPRFFPGIIAGVLYFLSVLQILKTLRLKREARTSEEPAEEPNFHMDFGSFLWVFGGFLGFALTLNILGWVIAAGLLFWCVAHGFGAKNHLGSLVTGLAVASVAYIAFDMGLGLSLPSGILGWGF